jgi:hypothetical protein
MRHRSLRPPRRLMESQDLRPRRPDGTIPHAGSPQGFASRYAFRGLAAPPASRHSAFYAPSRSPRVVVRRDGDLSTIDRIVKERRSAPQDGPTKPPPSEFATASTFSADLVVLGDSAGRLFSSQRLFRSTREILRGPPLGFKGPPKNSPEVHPNFLLFHTLWLRDFRRTLAAAGPITTICPESRPLRGWFPGISPGRLANREICIR